MNRNPTASEILDAVGVWLRSQDPAVSRFERLVAANAVGIAEREARLRPGADARAAAGLAGLLSMQPTDRAEMEAALCDAIRDGRIAPHDPALLDHLRVSAIDALAIDQPRYAHALAEPFDHA